MATKKPSQKKTTKKAPSREKNIKDLRSALDNVAEEDALELVEEKFPQAKGKTAKRTPEEIRAQWIHQATDFRKSLDLDLRDARDFSRYLLEVYGAKSDPKWQKIFVDEEQQMLLGNYKAGLLAWQQAMAPEGLQAARGLHSIAFLPGDDIAAMIILRRGSNDYSEGTSNYTMNAPVASWMFSTRGLHREHQVPSALLARAIVAKNKNFQERDLINRLITIEDDMCSSPTRKRASGGGRPARPEPREFSKAERAEILRISKDVSQPVVLVANIDKENFRSFGGDSESGDTMEAEIKVATCEPDCLAHIFVASRTPVGTPVDEITARYHALNEHWEVQGRFFSYGDDVTLHLHPETDLGIYKSRAKLVKHLPVGFRWYEVHKG